MRGVLSMRTATAGAEKYRYIVCRPGHHRAISLLRNSLLFALCVSVGMLFSSCRGQPDDMQQIVLPSTPVLSTSSSWAVINSSHLRLRDQPNVESGVVTTLWRGYVIEVLAKQSHLAEVEDETNYWYQVNHDGIQGWVFGAYLTFYGSHDTAIRAGESLRQ